jgi:hypothetical protein
MLNSDIPVANVLVFSKRAIAAAPQLPESVTKACALATKRFYDDRAFSIETFRSFDPQSQEKDVARLWDAYSQAQVIKRVPILTRKALQPSISRVALDVPAIKDLAPQQYIDNSVVVRLAKAGYYEKLFGPSVRDEQAAALADAV